MKELIYPVKVIDCANGGEGVDALFKVSYPQIGLTEPFLCKIPAGGYIILDYGMEYVGGIRILAHNESKNVRIRVGESVTETCAELGENGASSRKFPVRDSPGR